LLDAVMATGDLDAAARSAAADLATIDRRAHAGTKRGVRQAVAKDLRDAIESELAPPPTS
jgi:enoyl-CoA hydratase/carnithine racemase